MIPDFKERFIIYTDACDEGLGAVLCQIDKAKKCRPVAYYSKKLTVRERKYATGEKELMAILFDIVHFKLCLYCCEFIVRTDHRSLQWLRNKACPSTRLIRWLLIVRQFEFRIEFFSGKSNAAANVLSETRRSEYRDTEELSTGSKPDKQEESNSNELNWYYRHFDKFKVVGDNVYRQFKTKTRGSVFQYKYRRKSERKYSNYCMTQFSRDI